MMTQAELIKEMNQLAKAMDQIIRNRRDAELARMLNWLVSFDARNCPQCGKLPTDHSNFDCYFRYTSEGRWYPSSEVEDVMSDDFDN